MSANFEKYYKSYLKSIIKESTDVSIAEVDDSEVEPLKCVCFKTSDQALVDALKNGFSKIVVVSTDEDGEETSTDFDAASFGELEVTDDSDSDVCPECGNDPCTCEGKEKACPECGNDPCTCEKDETVVKECGDDPNSFENDDLSDSSAIDFAKVEDDDEDNADADYSKWLDDKGVCVKCGDPKCDGSCKCKKCGSPDCIGDCE